MLRRLAARHSGPFPFEALARMWQEMIAAFTQIQADYTVAVFVDDDNASMWDLARDQFGAQTPIHAYSSTREVLEQREAAHALLLGLSGDLASGKALMSGE